MSSWINPNLQIDDFNGMVRLFPLPNFVMFPGVVKGLHIFEPRYCAMLQESLSTDHLIAMALLQPGWEAEYYQHPSIYGVICIGRVVHHAVTSAGRHNILLSGLKRARIVRETNSSVDQFRRAEVVLLEDDSDAHDLKEQMPFRDRLVASFRRFSPAAKIFSMFPNSGIQNLPLGLLADLIADELPMNVEEKQAILTELNVHHRCEQLLKFLGDHRFKGQETSLDDAGACPDDDDSYPPNFSWN